MKVFTVILLFAALTATHSLPANTNEEKLSRQQDPKENPDKDVDFVPLGGRNPTLPGGGGVVDVDANGFFGNPFGNPLPTLFGSIEAMMTRLRQQLTSIMGQFPNRPEGGPFPAFNFPNLGGVDLGKGNTTSVTKVIDGHKVTINETEYKQGGESGAAVFKVRIIDVHPDSEESTETDSEVVPPNRDRESVEDTVNNEIPKIKDNEGPVFENIETFDEVDVVPPHKNTPARRNPEWNNANSIETIEDNSIDAGPYPHKYHDLSNDIYVNQLLADSGAPTNPDAEVFDVAPAPGAMHFGPRKSEKIMVPVNYHPAGGPFMPMPYLGPMNTHEPMVGPHSFGQLPFGHPFALHPGAPHPFAVHPGVPHPVAASRSMARSEKIVKIKETKMPRQAQEVSTASQSSSTVAQQPSQVAAGNSPNVQMS